MGRYILWWTMVTLLIWWRGWSSQNTCENCRLNHIWVVTNCEIKLSIPNVSVFIIIVSPLCWLMFSERSELVHGHSSDRCSAAVTWQGRRQQQSTGSAGGNYHFVTLLHNCAGADLTDTELIFHILRRKMSPRKIVVIEGHLLEFASISNVMKKSNCF